MAPRHSSAMKGHPSSSILTKDTNHATATAGKASKDANDTFERVDSMRQILLESTHARIYEQHPHFLDVFVIRNVADFKIDFETHLVPVSLNLDHRAVYTETL